MRTVSAFYNTYGGVLLFGVKDKTGEVVGVLDLQKVEHGFSQQLSAKLKTLDIRPTVEVVDYAGKKLLIVTCPKGRQAPYIISGYERPFVRIGSSNEEATDEQIAQMYRDRSTDPQDRYPLESATVDDLDLSSAEGYIRATARTDFQSENLIGALIAEGILAKKTDGTAIPTIAGMLLFGKNVQGFLPHAVIKADMKLDESKTDWDDIQTLDGTLFEQIRAAESFIKRNIPVSARIVGFRRIESPAIPLEGLREAVVNALVHRDYRDTSAEIHLRIRGNGVSVINPGGVITPLTIEIVLKGNFVPRSRNGTLAEALIRLGQYMEKRGTGVQRMRQLMVEASLPEPEFVEEANGFQVRFVAPLRTERKAPEQKLVIGESELKKLNLEDDHHLILKAVEAQGEVRPKEVDIILGKSRPTTVQRLDELVEKEVLERTTEKRQDPNVAFRLHRRFKAPSGQSAQANLGL